MSKVKSFNMIMEDEYGVYPNAIVAILRGKKAAEDEWESTDGIEDYSYSKPSIGMLEYTASYYQSADALLTGKKSRPLLTSRANLVVSERLLHTVDLNHEESQRIMNGGLSLMDMVNTLIEHDIKRNFNF